MGSRMSQYRSEGASPDIAAVLKYDSFEQAIRYSLERAAAAPEGSVAPSRPISALAGGRIVGKIGNEVTRLLRVARLFLRNRRP